jgi:hypothetical protein
MAGVDEDLVSGVVVIPSWVDVYFRYPLLRLRRRTDDTPDTPAFD